MSRVKFITKFKNFNFSLIFQLSHWKNLQFCLHSFHIFLLRIWYESILWVIMGRWGVFSERRRSSYSSWFRWWLVAWSAPSHYLNQCWNIVNSNLRTNFSEISSEIHAFPFTKMHLKMSSGKWRPFCLGLNVLNTSICQISPDKSPHVVLLVCPTNSLLTDQAERLQERGLEPLVIGSKQVKPAICQVRSNNIPTLSWVPFP